MSFVHSFTGFIPPARDDDEPWVSVRSEYSATENGSYATVETDALSPVDTDPSDPATRSITVNTAPAATGWFRFVFIDGDGNESAHSDPVFSPSDGAAWITEADIEGRLGDDLTTAQSTQVAALIPLYTSLVEAATGRDSDWSSALTPVPAALRLIGIEVIVRTLLSPVAGIESQTETLGAYSYTERFTSGGSSAGFALTDDEQRAVRRAVYGSGVASVRVGSAVDDIRSDIQGLDLSDET